MGRAEMLARMDSRELTGWLTLFRVKDIERQEAEEEARHRRESNDGDVVTYGKPRSEFDEDDDGETE